MWTTSTKVSLSLISYWGQYSSWPPHVTKNHFQDWAQLWGRHLGSDRQYQALLWHLGGCRQHCKQVSFPQIWKIELTFVFYRMDSTGVDGRIQVNERTRDVLKQVFFVFNLFQWKFEGSLFQPDLNKFSLQNKKWIGSSDDWPLENISTRNCDSSIFQWFEFEERGDIFVKGKDNMKVFLFTKQKESALRMF